MDPDRVYELVDGEWMLIPAESDRDYRDKRSQYEARGIPEYWIVDLQEQAIVVRSHFNSLKGGQL